MFYKDLRELVDAADVNRYGSRLGVIDGENGNWLTNVTGDVFQLFEDLDRKGTVMCKFDHSHIAAAGHEQN